MAKRRTKAEKQLDDSVDAAVSKHTDGRQFDIMDLSKLSDAGKTAGQNGEDIDAAVLAACIQYDQS